MAFLVSCFRNEVLKDGSIVKRKWWRVQENKSEFGKTVTRRYGYLALARKKKPDYRVFKKYWSAMSFFEKMVLKKRQAGYYMARRGLHLVYWYEPRVK